MAQSWLTLFRICTELHRVGSVWPELAQSGTDDSDWPELAPSGTKCAQNGKNWPLVAKSWKFPTSRHLNNLEDQPMTPFHFKLYPQTFNQISGK